MPKSEATARAVALFYSAAPAIQRAILADLRCAESSVGEMLIIHPNGADWQTLLASSVRGRDVTTTVERTLATECRKMWLMLPPEYQGFMIARMMGEWISRHPDQIERLQSVVYPPDGSPRPPPATLADSGEKTSSPG